MSNTKTLTTKLLIPITILIAAIFSTPKNAQADKSTIFKPVGEFSDVKEGNSYYVAINYLRENGIVEGYTMNGENTFRPNQNISRAEALKIFLLAGEAITDSEEVVNIGHSLKEPPFSDVPIDSWFSPYISLAKDKKIINGYKDGSFKPEAEINLAESLKIYFETLNIIKGPLNFTGATDYLTIDIDPDSWYAEYAGYAISKGIINVYSSNTINPDQMMTRGYLAEIIYRSLKSEEGFSFGKATYYKGRALKTNDTFDTNLMTTAHKTLPFGTILEVTNLANGKSVQVKVTDRGPYAPGRVLDLSKNAFSKIASPSEGVISVQYKTIEESL